jgi:hypothetical protein
MLEEREDDNHLLLLLLWTETPVGHEQRVIRN